jgi:hypothetical protein
MCRTVTLSPGELGHPHQPGGSVDAVGKFITRVRPGDQELWDRIVEEASRLCENETPMPTAVDRLIEMAGDNPRAFEGIGGKSTKGLTRTAQGQATIRLLGTAAAEWRLRSRVCVTRMIGRKCSSDEKALAAMPLQDAFVVLAQQEPRLTDVAEETLRTAEACRSAGQAESSVRAAVGEIFLRILSIEPIIGPKSPHQSRLVTSPTAVRVVWARMASIAGVSVLDLD